MPYLLVAVNVFKGMTLFCFIRKSSVSIKPAVNTTYSDGNKTFGSQFISLGCCFVKSLRGARPQNSAAKSIYTAYVGEIDLKIQI